MQAQIVVSNPTRSRGKLLPVYFTILSLLLLYSCATTGGVVDEPIEARIGESVANAESAQPFATQVPDEKNFYRIPEAGPEFWTEIMTSDVAYQYRAINGVSQCTIFVADVIDGHFGEELYSLVFPEGARGANDTFTDWIENQSLVWLSPDEYSIDDIQGLADEGYLILMAYYYAEISGHVAFVGHSDLDLFTYPPIDGLEGKNGRQMARSYFPVMVQAGTYTGVTSMVYATNGWLRNDNFGQGIVRYYAVSKS